MDAQTISSSRHLISPRSSSPSGGTCQNPEPCRQKREAMYRKMAEMLPQVLSDYEELLGSRMYRVRKHLEQRMDERDISFRQVVEVLEAYQPIEWSDLRTQQKRIGSLGIRAFNLQPYHMTVTGRSELYGGNRPLCIECTYGERPSDGSPWELHILTVYDPSLSHNKWDADFSTRICFCKHEPRKQSAFIHQRLAHYYQGEKCPYSPTLYSTTW